MPSVTKNRLEKGETKTNGDVMISPAVIKDDRKITVYHPCESSKYFCIVAYIDIFMISIISYLDILHLIRLNL